MVNMGEEDAIVMDTRVIVILDIEEEEMKKGKYKETTCTLSTLTQHHHKYILNTVISSLSCTS